MDHSLPVAPPLHPQSHPPIHPAPARPWHQAPRPGQRLPDEDPRSIYFVSRLLRAAGETFSH